MVTEVIGFIASVCLIFSSLPQIIHTLKTKNVEGLALGTLILWFLGMFLMGLYVLWTTMQLPLLLNYGFNTFVVGANIYLYVKYKQR